MIDPREILDRMRKQPGNADNAPALLDALDAVLELHEPFEGSDRGGDIRCSGCYDSRYGVFEPYPCELVEAIANALEDNA